MSREIWRKVSVLSVRLPPRLGLTTRSGAVERSAEKPWGHVSSFGQMWLTVGRPLVASAHRTRPARRTARRTLSRHRSRQRTQRHFPRQHRPIPFPWVARRIGRHACVLIDNHYHHLLLETPEANLSRAMHWLNVASACAWRECGMIVALRKSWSAVWGLDLPTQVNPRAHNQPRDWFPASKKMHGSLSLVGMRNQTVSTKTKK